MQQLSPKHLTAYYVAALLLIAALSVVSHAILSSVIGTDRGAAAIINVSGRQRMLSQRITSLAAQYELGDVAVRPGLLADIAEFESAHEHLLLVQRQTPPSEEGAAIERLYFSAPANLDRRMRKFIDIARRLAEMPSGDPASRPLFAEMAREAGKPLLAQLNEVVGLHQQNSERHMAWLNQVQWFVLGAVLLTLLIEARFIFQPMVSRITGFMATILQLSLTDYLTGAANRRSFMERGNAELARSRRYQRPLSLLMIDADNFKRINDTYGHAAGDEVLKKICSTLKASLRAIDTVGRLGGEEFAILLPETPLVHATALAERLRATIERMSIAFEEHTIRLTVSMGVVEVPVGTREIESALGTADMLLYEAKNSGRNRVVARNSLIESGAASGQTPVFAAE